MDESLINSLKSLAESSAWQEVRDNYISARIAEIKDVTKKADLGVSVPPDVMFVGKALAAVMMENIVYDIDRFAKTNKKDQVETYE